MDPQLAAILLGVTANALVGLVIWNMTGFRKSLHELRNSLQPLASEVAVLKALRERDERLVNELIKTLAKGGQAPGGD